MASLPAKPLHALSPTGRTNLVSLLRRGCALLPLALMGALAVSAAPTAAYAEKHTPSDAAPPAVYQGDADKEAALVLGEEERIATVRKTVSLWRWLHPEEYRTPKMDKPDKTAVLVPQTADYDITFLVSRNLAVEQADGYLLKENLFVAPGATLSLRGLTKPLRMLSGSDGVFV